MLDRIRNVFTEVTGVENPDLTLKTKIDKIPELSSLGMVQLVCGLEDEFDIEIPNTVLKKFKTVGDVVKFLEKNA
ncbi:MAG: acyl carrier protein [Clostridia bacterium]|nr:acyl carrier protein [Clostridia bacterium]MBR5544194.1 acyl carrier protein [Clostridia bacterium]